MIAVSPAVDVWKACLPGPAARWAQRSCLHPDEVARAERFHFAGDRARWVAARTVLRQIVADYVDASPEWLRFGYGPQGKPFLLDAPDLQFNLSHTADLLVVAVARGRPVGVDVEAVATDAVIDLVAPVVLSPPELAMCRPLAGQTRREAFARIWTRKEAYIKADGRGLSLPLVHIDVATSEHRVRLRDDARDAWTACSRWTLQPVEVAPGYAATVAAEGSDWRSACCEWDG